MLQVLAIWTCIFTVVGLHGLLFIWTIVCCKKADDKKNQRKPPACQKVHKSDRSGDVNSKTVPANKPTRPKTLMMAVNPTPDDAKTAIHPVREEKVSTPGRGSNNNNDNNENEDKDKESNNSDATKTKTKTVVLAKSATINSREKTEKLKDGNTLKDTDPKNAVVATERENKIAKGLVVRRQSDYPEMNENLSDYDEGSNSENKKTKSTKKSEGTKKSSSKKKKSKKEDKSK